MTCQYCGQPALGFCCQECLETWPRKQCTCENNGDYCPACLAWVEERAKLKEVSCQVNSVQTK